MIAAAALAACAAPALATPDVIERVSNSETDETYAVTEAEAAALYGELAGWSEANVEAWRRLVDVFALPAALLPLADDPAAEPARAAWGEAFDRAITETSFFIEGRPRLPRLFLLGPEGERLRDALYVTNATQQDALDALAALGTAMNRDVRAVLAGAPDAAAARERLRIAAQEVESLRALIDEVAENLDRVAAAARSDDRPAVSALAARLNERDTALRDLARRRRS